MVGHSNDISCALTWTTADEEDQNEESESNYDTLYHLLRLPSLSLLLHCVCEVNGNILRIMGEISFGVDRAKLFSVHLLE